MWLLLLACPSSAPVDPASTDSVLTRIVATVDVGFGSTLSVRGDAAPLSWERGWWAWPAASDRWELVLTEVEEGFAYKTLLDDVTWQTGEDATGVETEVRPTF